MDQFVAQYFVVYGKYKFRLIRDVRCDNVKTVVMLLDVLI